MVRHIDVRWCWEPPLVAEIESSLMVQIRRNVEDEKGRKSKLPRLIATRDAFDRSVKEQNKGEET